MRQGFISLFLKSARAALLIIYILDLEKVFGLQYSKK